MKALVIYHAPHCNDGFTAAWAAYHGILNLDPTSTVLLYPMGYNLEEDEQLIKHLAVEKYDWIYVVDFSLRLQVLSRVMDKQPDIKGLTILDHHKSAFEMYAPAQEVTKDSMYTETMFDAKVLIILDNDKSGAMLAWRHWNSGNVPVLVQHVEDRDLWRFNIPFTKAVHMYLGDVEKTLDDWDDVAEMMEMPDGYNEVVTEGTHLLRDYQQEVMRISAHAKPCTIHGKEGLMVECDGKYASDVGNALAKTAYTYGLTYSYSEDGTKIVCSLRSNGDYNVEAMAKKLGGGGHLNAAGFAIEIEEMATAFGG